MFDDVPMMLERKAGEPQHADQILVGFTLYHAEDDAQSALAGHPCYVELEFVKIVVPGDKNTMIFQPADDGHRRNYPQAYAAFKAGEKKPTLEDGDIPITEWPVINRATAMTLKAAHIYSVKTLAQLQETHLEKLGYNMRELQAKAKVWFDQAKGAAVATKAAAENEGLKAQIAALQAQMTALATQVQTPAEAPRRGRPPKHAIGEGRGVEAEAA